MGLCRIAALCALVVVASCAKADSESAEVDANPGSLNPLPNCDEGAPDGDGDGVCDARDQCEGEDDALDDDNDGIPDACDVCAGFHDDFDDDGDGIPDGCDLCPNDIDNADDDGDGVCNSADPCPADNPDDSDGDGVCNSADVCAAGDDTIDADGNAIPDACDCLGAFEVRFNDICYFLDGVNGACGAGSQMAPQSVLSSIAAQFVGKTYRTQISDNCCIKHANQAAEQQDWGMNNNSNSCNTAGAFPQGPIPGGSGCNNVNLNEPRQLTLCQRDPNVSAP